MVYNETLKKDNYADSKFCHLHRRRDGVALFRPNNHHSNDFITGSLHGFSVLKIEVIHENR